MSEKADEFLAHMGIEAPALAHMGKKGMKWGKTSAIATVGSSKKAKPTSDEIKAARNRQAVRESKLETKAFETYIPTTKKGQKLALEAYNRAEQKVLSHPDANTAAKMTKGEKVATGILGGIYGAMLIGAVGITIAANKPATNYGAGGGDLFSTLSDAKAGFSSKR